MKTIIKILFFSACLLSITAKAQDIHFSQFYSNSLFLNPALTGSTCCNFRAGANYKNQWKSIDASYETQSAFLEKKFDLKKYKRDWMGGGLLLYNDNAGSGVMKTTSGMVAMAYHKGLDKDNKFYASFGSTFGFANRSIDFSSLVFDSQWTDFGFDVEQPNDESLANESYIYLDFNVGTVVTYFPNDKLKVHFGTGLNHLNRPKDSFAWESEKLKGVRKYIHSGVDVKLGNSFYLQPKIYYTAVKKSSELILGLNTAYISKDTRFYVGMWNRQGRDIIAVLGFEFSQTIILMSYDINYSSLSIATKSKGGVEVSLVKSFKCSKDKKAAKFGETSPLL